MRDREHAGHFILLWRGRGLLRMGAPMNFGPLANEPVNEMGAMCLFVLLGRKAGFHH